LRDRVDAEVRAQARSQADVVAATAAELLTPARRSDLARLARIAARSVRGRVIVVDARGVVVADSAGRGQLGRDYSDRPEVRVALRDRTTQDTRHSRTLDRELLATAVPVLRAGRPAGAVRITQGVDAVGRAVRRAILGLALVGVVVLAIGLVAGALIAGQVARPIRRLERAALLVSEGDLDARAPVEGSTEQRSLARAFNEMTSRVARLLRGQRDFVADASHQLRTPLTALRLRLEEAVERTEEPAVVEELDAATREVDRLAEMVEELLVLSRAGERELPGEPVDLGGAVDRAVERWRGAAAEAGIELTGRTVATGQAWCASADLDRALDSLLENALRYSPSGTTVRVEARPSGIDVLDEGPGLAPDEEQEVFERFHRGRAGRRGPSGTGLGLPIARELAREWGGTVTLVSRPERGARATLELPPSRPAAA
jgi:two-component system, OmpR family, sensor kinase